MLALCFRACVTYLRFWVLESSLQTQRRAQGSNTDLRRYIKRNCTLDDGQLRRNMKCIINSFLRTHFNLHKKFNCSISEKGKAVFSLMSTRNLQLILYFLLSVWNFLSLNWMLQNNLLNGCTTGLFWVQLTSSDLSTDGIWVAQWGHKFREFFVYEPWLLILLSC
jgi:hypothetical protein